MENTKKRKSIAIVLILLMTIAISLLALPAVTAQSRKKTYPYIGAMPNPVGVGQETLIHFGISDQLAHTEEYQHEGWFNLTVTITKPDGTTEILGPFVTDTTGGTGIQYTPSIVGTYYLQVHFPEQTLRVTSTGMPTGTVMLASDSEKLALNVTEQPRDYYPGVPLPTEFWTRPVNAQFREWGTVVSDWWATPPNRFAPYNDAPETPHILWTKPLAEGGLSGSGIGEEGWWGKGMVGYEFGDAYEGKFTGSVIINGVLYFNRQIAQARPTASGSTAQSMISDLNVTTIEQRVVALNLKTGETLWDKVLGDNERLSFGQTMLWKTMNMYGTFSYLWTTSGNTWKAYDPLTGRWEYTMTDVPSGTSIYGPNGEILRYTVNTANGWMTMWNSTHAGFNTYYSIYMASTSANDRASAAYYAERWRPQGLTINATKGIQWNVSIPKDLPGNANAYFYNDLVLGGSINSTGRLDDAPIAMWALSLKPGRVGQLVYNTTWKPPAGQYTLSFGARSNNDRVFTVRCKELRAFFGFNMDTGQNIWGPTPSRPYMDLFMGGPSGENGMIGYGKLFLGTLGGILQAIDVKTGELSWEYAMKQPYTELMWGGANWPIELAFISDGKVYLLHTEHSGNTPLPRGAPFVILNATTGEVIFRVEGLFRFTVWGGDPAIADSTAVIFSTYDNLIYAVGKGPSKTTVTAPDIGTPQGSSVTIRGMVTDVSAGALEYARSARFPNGVPAVSDESMGEWMKYVYVQFPRPANVKGVEVSLGVLDSNGNFREIGKTISDSNGFYSFSWIPDIPGKFTVYASFAGSESYWPSNAETAFVVDPAPPAPPQPAEFTPSMVETYLLPGIVAIIVSIAVVGAIILLTLRKRS